MVSRTKKSIINTPADGSCGYVAFYDERQAEVYADSSYAATVLARKHFKAPRHKEHMVAVMLCEKNGEQVETSARDI